MQFIACAISGVWLITPTVHGDDRGRFFRAWCEREFRDHEIEFHPVQANIGTSRLKGTIRGLHFQVEPALEAKLARCTSGAVFDVVVDVRPESPTFGQWFGAELSVENGHMLYVPEHCAHGYQTLRDQSELHYMTSAFYAPDRVRGVRFDDPGIGINWPLPATVVSDQDRGWPLLNVQRSEAS